MKKLLIISILALSSLSFGATALEQSLMNLDQQLQKLDQMEQQKFNQQKALADAAQGRLDKYREMDATIEQRIADIKTNAEVSIFGKEFKQKSAEYNTLRGQLAKEIEKEKKVISDFQLLESLR